MNQPRTIQIETITTQNGGKLDVIRDIKAVEKTIAELNDARKLLREWVKYFQSDIPMTGESAEAQGEEFTRIWFETQKALSPESEQKTP